MANIYALTDPKDGKYCIELSVEELKRMEIDNVFAHKKLEEAKIALLNKENSPFESNVTYKWSHEATLLLIDEFRQRMADFTSGKISQKKVWDAIAKNLIQKGHEVTGPQCMSKFSGLKRTYKSTKDHNTKSGNNTRFWMYYKIMDELLGKKPFMEPVATVSSTGSTVASTSYKRQKLQSECLNFDTSNTLTARRKSKESEKLSILLNIEKSRKIAEERRQRRHEERMKQRAEAIEIMKQIAESLNIPQIDS